MRADDITSAYNFLDHSFVAGLFRGETQRDPILALNLRGRPLDAARCSALTIRAWMSESDDDWGFVYTGRQGEWALATGPRTVSGWALYKVDLHALDWGPGGQFGGPGSQKWGGTSRLVTSLRLDPGNRPNRTILIDYVALGPCTPQWQPGVIRESTGLASSASRDWCTPLRADKIIVAPQWKVATPGRSTGLAWARVLLGSQLLCAVDLRLRPRGDCAPGTLLRSQPSVLTLPRLRRQREPFTIEVGLYDFDHPPMSITVPPPPEHPEPATAHIALHSGRPTFFLDRSATPAMAFLSMGPQRLWYQQMGRIGTHLYNDVTPLGNQTEGSYDFSGADAVFYNILSADPDAYFIPRIDLTAPWWWQAKYPDECCVYHDGTAGPQSFASQRWLDDISKDLREYIRHVRSAPYGDRVIGFHLCTGYTGEWQAWGLWEGKFGDYSRPSRDAFRAWLARRYGSDQGLQAAWADPLVSLKTAEIPPLERRHGLETGVLRDLPGRGRQVTDFYRFYAESAASAITHLAGVAKEASGRQCLVGFFYGYQTQHGWLELDSQHLALDHVLACPDIDFLVSPAMYTGRAPGGASNFMSATDSVNLHGKLWLDEADLRTYKSPESDPFGRAADLPQSVGLLRREFGHVLSRGAGMWWFDMTGGWFNDRRLLREMRRMNQIASAGLAQDRSPNAQVAVFIDEQSLFYTVPHPALNEPLITQQIAAMFRLGAPWDFYLLPELANPALPDYQVYVFLNAFYLDPAVREAIDARVKKAGNTAIWIYAPGCLTDHGIDLQAAHSLTGIKLSLLPGAGSLKMNVPQPALFPGFEEATTFGVADFPGPIFYADDPDAQVLAVLEDIGKPGLALKETDGWTSIFCASPNLPPNVLRWLLSRAGVHVYGDGPDALYANRFMLCVHAPTGGKRLLRTPSPTDWYDPFADEVLARHAQELSLDLAQYETRLFLLGDADHWRVALGPTAPRRE